MPAISGAHSEQIDLANTAGVSAVDANKLSGADLTQAAILKSAGNKTIADALGTTQALLLDTFDL